MNLLRDSQALRLRRRGAAFFTACALVGVTVLSSGTASAHPAIHLGEGGNGTYLALGDSVAFGYVPSAALPPPDYSNASNFTSYANDVAQSLGLNLSNASCPGETTGSMIDVSAHSNGCENYLGNVAYGYRTNYPLHVTYSGSQLAYAVAYLRSHPHTRLVTIDIGANDAFVCQTVTTDNCASPTEFYGVLGAIEANLTTIYHAIRVEAHYTHALVALDYYSLSYTDPVQLVLSEALNQAIAAPTLAAHGIVADGFGAFQAASASSGGDPCVAGLLIKLPDGTCNIHPSPLGHEVLAQAILQALAAKGS